jgi:hypothetical protein
MLRGMPDGIVCNVDVLGNRGQMHRTTHRDRCEDPFPNAAAKKGRVLVHSWEAHASLQLGFQALVFGARLTRDQRPQEAPPPPAHRFLH